MRACTTEWARRGGIRGGTVARQARSPYDHAPPSDGADGPVHVTIHAGSEVERLGLLGVLERLESITAVDAAAPHAAPRPAAVATSAPAQVLVVLGPPTTAITAHPLGIRRPVIAVTRRTLPGRELLRALQDPVRGLVRLDAVPATWACAITSVARGGWFVDPLLLRELVLVAAVGTPYGPRPLGLTPQQQRILALVAHGRSNRAIGQALGISPETVKSHLAAAMRLLDARTRHDAAARLTAALAENA